MALPVGAASIMCEWLDRRNLTKEQKSIILCGIIAAALSVVVFSEVWCMPDVLMNRYSGPEDMVVNMLGGNEQCGAMTHGKWFGGYLDNEMVPMLFTIDESEVVAHLTSSETYPHIQMEHADAVAATDEFFGLYGERFNDWKHHNPDAYQKLLNDYGVESINIP